MDDPRNKKALETRQAELTQRAENAVSVEALGVLDTAEARYAAAITVTTAPITVTTTTRA